MPDPISQNSGTMHWCFPACPSSSRVPLRDASAPGLSRQINIRDAREFFKDTRGGPANNGLELQPAFDALRNSNETKAIMAAVPRGKKGFMLTEVFLGTHRSEYLSLAVIIKRREIACEYFAELTPAVSNCTPKATQSVTELDLEFLALAGMQPNHLHSALTELWKATEELRAAKVRPEEADQFDGFESVGYRGRYLARRERHSQQFNLPHEHRILLRQFQPRTGSIAALTSRGVGS